MATRNKDRQVGTRLAVMSQSDGLAMLSLPAFPQGSYTFAANSHPAKYLNVVARGSVWCLTCQAPMEIVSKNGRSVSADLKHRHLYRLAMPGWQGTLSCEDITYQGQIFHSYRIAKNSISIGKLPSNDIVCPHAFSGNKRVSIFRIGDVWQIDDPGASSHVYVNNRHASHTTLKVGDSIYIVGLRILFGDGFVSINDGDGRAKVNPNTLCQIRLQDSMSAHSRLEPTTSEPEPFNRLPRRRLPMAAEPIEVEGPPAPLHGDQLPMLLRMGGTLAQGGASLLMGNLVSLFTSILFPLLSRGYTQKEREEYERRRVAAYTNYLAGVSQAISDEVAREQTVLKANYPSTEKAVSEAGLRRHLWARRAYDDDFLDIRVGTGSTPLLSPIDYPRKRYAMDRDPLEEKMYALVEKQYLLSDAPIVTSLVEYPVVGITGDAARRIAFAQTLMMQLVSEHSYDEVKIVVLASRMTLRKLPYVPYLPHVWDNRRTMRFVATSLSEANQVGKYLREELGGDVERPRKLEDILRDRPYYVVFAFDRRLFESIEVFKESLRINSNVGLSAVIAYDNLPKETSEVFSLIDSQHASLIHLRDIERERVDFVPDALETNLIYRTSRTLANTELRMVDVEEQLPESVTFLETFGVGRIESLNPVKRWADSDPSKSLAAPVGLAPDGSTFMLDLHEKYHGPHGLIAGMTGSGKSEFILSYVLSMAVSYHPYEVAFVLIDYKGGGLAGAFADENRGVRLPHVVGTITNLDGSAVKRAMTSINSELRRRQHIFNKTRSAVNADTMDIYKYQRLYRQNVVSEPIPHLFIISDEFAELKQQEPEFMAELISAARIGRSLGVHLILATQKPAGVVNDQILSNTKFRVCLKVQTRADSTDMLGRPEAAELQQTGRFYLQVGYNEMFVLGQSAYSGAPYIPSDQVENSHAEAVRMVDITGQVIGEARPAARGKGTGKSQLVEIVEMLTKTAAQMGVKPRQLWRQPLPRAIDVDTLNRSADNLDAERASAAQSSDHIRAHIGIIDDVAHQRQMPLTIDFNETRNILIVGSVQSGKSTALQTMLFSLAQRYSPQQVNFYVLDYSNSLLAEAAGLPHCGILLNGDDDDKLDDFFGLLDKVIEKRRLLFEKLRVTSFENARRLRPLPLVLVFIDNVGNLTSSKAARAHYDTLGDRMKAAFNYGIKYIITCSSLTGEVSQRMLRQLGERICLSLDDKYAYRTVLGSSCDFMPSPGPGRGMYVYNEAPMELQVARLLPALEGRTRTERLHGLSQELVKRYAGQGSARTIPAIPENEEYADFACRFKLGRFPLGYAEKNIKSVAIPLRQMPVLSVYFGNPLGVQPIWDNLMFAARRESMDIVVMQAARRSVFADDSSLRLFAPTPEEIRSLGEELVQIMSARKPLLEQYAADHGLDVSAKDLGAEAFEYLRTKVRPLLVVFERFADVCSNAGDAVAADLSKIISVARKYNVFFIAGFYPDDGALNSALFTSYNPKGLCMLFGGRHDKQQLVQFPYGATTSRAPSDYNRAVMQYRGSLYGLVMPCGQLLSEDVDPEEVNIFL